MEEDDARRIKLKEFAVFTGVNVTPTALVALEIDGVTIRALSPDGSVTHASARRAVTNGDASEVQLLGGAQVVRENHGNGQKIEFASEFLHAFLTTERLRSHLPVQLRQGTSELRVGSIDYDHLTQFARLGPPVRAHFEVPKR
jgi:lipopolysaccharide export system protein LptC